MCSSLEIQNDELQALEAIYGEDFHMVEPEARIFSIRISLEPSQPGSDRTVTLQFRIPRGYPLNELIEFDIHAPWLRGPTFDRMHNALKQLASESGDSPIVFSLVEYARTFLQSDALEMHVSGEQGGAQEVRGQAETQRVTGALTSNALSVRAHLNRSRISNSSDIDGRELQIFHGETIVDRKSVFQAHCCRVQSVEDVSRFISAVLNDRKVAAATHNILAWRFITKCSMSSSDVVLADCDDDGETHAGSRLLHLLTISCAENVAVMVSRWYGGIQLGPDRFKHINNVARQLLSLHGMLGPQQLHSEESKAKSQKQKPKKKR